MEVKDAARRILWHYKLLIVLTILGGVVAIVARGDRATMFVAPTRMVVAPSDVDSSAAADSVAAIATSEARIRAVLLNAGIDRDAGTVADRVSVSPIGTSDVVEISVRDQDPRVAVDIAQGLTGQVITVLRRSGLSTIPLPYVIENANLATTRVVATGGVQDIALGALLGLVLGILLTALLEAVSPTIIGADSIALELGAPLLTVLRRWPRVDDRLMAWTSWQVSASAKRVHVKTVEIAAVDRSIDVRRLSDALAEQADGRVAGQGSQGPGIRALGSEGLPLSANGSVGLVIATPTVVKRGELEPVQELMGVTGWPTVGIIGIERRVAPRWFQRWVRRSSGDAPVPSSSKPRPPWRASSDKADKAS
jgi:capsular polysaccharide biosynthesis protein